MPDVVWWIVLVWIVPALMFYAGYLYGRDVSSNKQNDPKEDR